MTSKRQQAGSAPLSLAERRRHAARRQDFVVHVITDENLTCYVPECAAAAQLCDRREAGASPLQLVWPTLTRDHSRWLSGDTLLIAVATGKADVRGTLRLSSMTSASSCYDGLRRFATVGIERSPAVWLWDGFAVASMRAGTGAPSGTTAALLAGVQSYALQAEIEQLVAVIDVAWLPHLLESGWNPLPLGIPREVRGRSAIAVSLHVSELALKRTRSLFAIAGPRLIRRGLSRRRGNSGQSRRLC